MAELSYDDMVSSIGDFGPYQKRVFVIFCLPAVMKAAVMMGAVFILSLPEFRCRMPDYPGDTFTIQNDFHRQLINETIPNEITNDEESYASCSLYSSNSLNMTSTIDSAYNNISKINKKEDCSEWVYQPTEYSSSITTEYDLVCENRVMRSHINMGFFLGALIGSFIFGLLADVLGRKVSLILCVALQCVCGISFYFVDSLYAIIAIRSVQGMTIMMFAIAATTGMELVGPSRRTFAGVVIEFFWSAGMYLVALVYFLTNDWRLFQLIFGFASLLVIGAFYFAPESPRWLLDKGKTSKAERIFKKIAKSNKTTWNSDLLTCQKAEDQESTAKTFRRLLKNRLLLIRSFIIVLNWFAVNFLYYGLSFNLGNLSGSLYVNYLLGATVETVGFLVCYFMLMFMGRKTGYVVTMIIGGLACLLVIIPTIYGDHSHQWTIILLAMIGKLSSAITYTILYIITVELFPTTARNSILGVCSVFENCGGLVSPYVADLGILVGGPLKQALPLLVFGAVTLIAGLTSLGLPETKGRPLPETFDDVIAMNAKGRNGKGRPATEKKGVLLEQI